MKIKKIQLDWGIEIDADITEVLTQGPEFWRRLGYQNDLILFKGLGNISNVDHFKLCSYFGKPWTKEEYAHSGDVTYEFPYGNESKSLTRFSNILSPRLGTEKMRWHADIPLNGDSSFPWRSLYMVSNPSPDSGLTSWLNIKLKNIQPADDQLAYYNRMSLTMQSWHKHDNYEVNDVSFIKQDPVTQEKSLRANCYDTPECSKLWIKEVLVDNNVVDNNAVLGNIIRTLESRSELVYTHRWNLYDFIIYNNNSFIHMRTKIILNSKNESREFIRANMSHVPDVSWESYKETL
jgi:alpha-ketoglutarate-dependent taurine dioxygenase